MTKVIYGCQVEVGDLQSGGVSKCTLHGHVDDQLETDYNACKSVSTGLILRNPLSVALLPAPSAEPSEFRCSP